MPNDTDRPSTYISRVLIAAGITAALIVLALLVWYTAQVLVVIFAGILFGVFLRALTELLRQYVHMPQTLALFLVLLALALLIGFGGWYLATDVAHQFDELGQTLVGTWEAFQSNLMQYRWGRQLLQQGGDIDQIMAHAAGAFGVIFAAAGYLLVLLILGLYIAYDPGLYRRGILHLTPIPHRERAEEVIDTLDYTMRWWLIGRLVSMLFVGALTTIGLLVFGIPMALALGLIAFFLDFVPYIGPIIAAIPGVLIAMSLGQQEGISVLILYVVIQQLEGYLITPLVQQRVVEMPPAILVSSQILLAVILGIPGLIFATPLTVVGLVLVKLLYVQDVLGDPIEVQGEPNYHDDANRPRSGSDAHVGSSS